MANKGEQFMDLQQKMLKVEGYNDFQKINDYLYIGNQIGALKWLKIREEGITHVLKVNGITANTPTNFLKYELRVVNMEDHE